MPIGGRKQTTPVKSVMVKVNSPVNQDATVILITRTDEDGKTFYVKDFVWEVYQGFDLLDVSEIGTTAPVVVRETTVPIAKERINDLFGSSTASGAEPQRADERPFGSGPPRSGGE